MTKILEERKIADTSLTELTVEILETGEEANIELSEVVTGEIVEPATESKDDILTVCLPLDGHTTTSLCNLVTMIYSRGKLISKATGGAFACTLEQVEALKNCTTVSDVVRGITEDLVGLSISDDMLTFAFPYTDNPEKIMVFTQLAMRMNKTAKKQRRVMAKAVDTTNERYIFRIWLLNLGMYGDEFKTVRRVLLSSLSGNAAFKDQAMEERWKKKQAMKCRSTKTGRKIKQNKAFE